MKRFLSILLLLITALYVLPGGNGFTAEFETAVKYVDKACEDGKDVKKDSGKEFIPTAFTASLFNENAAVLPAIPALFICPADCMPETPPPDMA